jgi:hypothetical protein
MTAPRLLVIVLVLIAVLFVISLAAGSSHGNQPPNSAGIVSALKGLRSSPLRSFDARDQASPSCASGPTAILVGSSACTITLDKRGFFSRPIRVILSQTSNPMSTVVQVHVQPNSGAAQTMTLNPGDCLDTAVSRSGGTITMSSAAPVALALVGSC